MPLFIGTAGWAIPAGVRDAFPQEGTALGRYARVLGCVEVNSSFHRPHRRSTWERWADTVPESFVFSAKIPKVISHVLRMAKAEAQLERFISEVEVLRRRLAVLLLQLPPSLPFDPDVTAAFVARLRLLTGVPLVVEPRHPSWFEPQAEALLASVEAARVGADPAKVPAGAVPGGWRGMTYFRLHGSPVIYRSPYGESRLRGYAAMLASEVAAERPTWCIFDNTASSAALANAIELVRQMDDISGPT